MADVSGVGSSPPQKAKSRIGEANVEKILDAALTAFAVHGFQGTRLDQIADAAGMSKPNLLYYFSTKEALYMAVLSRTLEMWFDSLRAIDGDADPRQALLGYIDRKLAYSRSNPEASRLFALEVIAGAPMLARVLSTELAEVVEAKVAVLKRWVSEGRLAPIEPVHFLFAVWATTQTYADFAGQVRALTGKDLNDPGFFEETRANVARILLDGVIPAA